MLTARPQRIFSSRFELHDDDGTVGDLKMSNLRESAKAVVNGRQLTFYRDGFLRGPYLLEADGKLIAKAMKPSFLRANFEISFGNARCELKKKGLFRSAFEVLAEGRVVGKVERKSVWKRSAQIDLPPEWPDALSTFILWLGLVMWKREAAAAAG